MKNDTVKKIAYQVFIPDTSNAFFMFGVDSNQDNSTYPIVNRTYCDATTYIYDKYALNLLNNSILSFPTTREGAIKHVLASTSVENIAKEIFNFIKNETPSCLSRNTRGFVAVDVNLLEEISKKLIDLGCNVVLADDIFYNNEVENDELFYERNNLYVINNDSYDNFITAQPANFTTSYAQNVDFLNSAEFSNDIQQTEAYYTNNINVTDFSMFQSSNQLVIYTQEKSETKEDAADNEHTKKVNWCLIL